MNAVDYINSFLKFGSKPGLERISNLLKLLGNPEKDLKFIHVAGTNGKGSTCCYISNILRAAGYKVGMFISPYVLEFRERFQINGEMIPYDELESITQMVKAAVDTLDDEMMVTEFELITAISYIYFKQNKCDVVVLEVGLGGMYDSTNTIDTPCCSVITSISFDHTAILGNTLSEIAAQKCGIIKQSGRCVSYPVQSDGAMSVIKSVAREKQNTLVVPDLNSLAVSDNGIFGSAVRYKGLDFSLRMAGKFQPYNAVVAIEAVKLCGLCISDEQIREGLSNSVFPARCELINNDPIIILDGAHNPDGVTALARLIENLPCSPIGVMGMMADKDIDAVMEIIAPLLSKIYCVTPKNPRSISAQELCRIASRYTEAIAFSDTEKAVTEARNENKPLVVCGSFYLASEVRPWLIG
ncbi:MAG: bifunctional folylpolyglutamate synthase/dihydrofolate synthase [Clostridia bacterium]|nr:bifunctional folylpolyglutamate synthase/dihydrofolate synthase [Clostridia bacterium]MEE1023534.1 folylpolyglutamate synthase/dihydrofolate synthase family protein [Acutalibacteraceae bacterium]